MAANPRGRSHRGRGFKLSGLPGKPSRVSTTRLPSAAGKVVLAPSSRRYCQTDGPSGGMSTSGGDWLGVASHPYQHWSRGRPPTANA